MATEKNVRACLLCLIFLSFLKSTISMSKGPKRYDGYRVIRVTPPNSYVGDDDVRKLLMSNTDLDIWRRPSVVMHSYDVMIPPKMWVKITNKLSDAGATYVTTIKNVQQLIDKQQKRARSRRARRHSRRFMLHRYHTFEEIRRWMHQFARANRDIVRLVQVGVTYRGRRILAMKIGVPSKNGSKRIIWQDAGIHAREWVTGSTLIWISRKLVKGYREGDHDITNYLKQMDWYLLPIWNVDGYRYTWSKDRMWRKSRSQAGSYDCYGVDLNRNFKTPNRGEGTSSANPCSEVYHGSYAFSEIESSSVKHFMLKKQNLLAAVLTLHSYAQYWLYPYGYTNMETPDHDELKSLSEDAVNAMQKKHGTVYKHGTVSELAYPVSGGSIDWCYRTLCVKYTFAVELRDTGNHGFMLPPSLIIPTAEEYYEGLEVVVRHVLNQSAGQQRSSFCSNKTDEPEINF